MRVYLILLTMFATFAAAAQSRMPEVKIEAHKKTEPADTSGYEERPYFLLIGQSEKALEDNDYEAAGLRLVEAMSVEPNNPLNVALLSNLGMIYYYNDQDSMALVTLEEAIRRSPRLVAAHENRARVLTGLHRDSEAYDEYTRIIEIDSINTNAHYYHGMMALYGGDLQTATADFEVLERLIPNTRKAMLAQATLLSMTGRNREAITYYRRLLDRERLPEYFAALAGCLLAVDDLSELSRVLNDGMKLWADDPELYMYRARLNQRRFMADDARRDARRAVELGINPARVADLLN